MRYPWYLFHGLFEFGQGHRGPMIPYLPGGPMSCVPHQSAPLHQVPSLECPLTSVFLSEFPLTSHVLIKVPPYIECLLTS
ncbi:unnamed protein product, partial [Staurois parvus]